MPDRLVHHIDRREGERICFSISEFKGSLYLSVRVYFRADDGEWRPTKKGVTVHVEQLPELEAGVAALRGAIDEAPAPTSRPGRLERHRRARTEEPEPANSGKDARRRA
jgi:hypothetical protein